MSQTAILQAPCELKPALTPLQRLSNKYSLERSIRYLQRDIKRFTRRDYTLFSASCCFNTVRHLKAELREKETLLKELLVNE